MFNFRGDRNKCYCAFCKSPRRIYRKKSISFLNVLASAFAAAVFMLIFWQEFDPRVSIAFVVCLALAEIFVKLRWRLSIVCRICGFDPVTYKKNPEVAVEKVRTQLQVRKQEPQYLLAKPLNLPAIPAGKAKALAEKSKGQLVSRSI